jgi:uncharacterized coiled-coil protein SlyX
MRFAAILLLLAAARPAAADTERLVAWDDADKHIGEEATVEGRVVGVHCSPLSCLLAFEPTFNRFTAVVQARSFDTFPPAELERRYSGKRVRVHGKIEQRDGKPEIVVEKPDDLAQVGAARRREREGEAATATADAAQRMADVLERVGELTERMAAVQERMEALLARLEEHEAALAAAQQASQPPPPPPPSYGEAQPRPAYESLRTVKRGMSRADVQRLIGQPQFAEDSGGGWSTWYYGFGRSITFDARGRAQSLVGFPSP